MMSRIKWYGDQNRRRVQEASRIGIDEIMGEAVNHAKRNHTGWRNITGAAEGSVQVIRGATIIGDRVSGEWGSRGIGYVIWLELKHGSFLRNAADSTYGGLIDRIRAHLR